MPQDDILGSYASAVELDSHDNNALHEELFGSGMDKKQVVKKLAAFVWYVTPRPIVADTISMKERKSRLKENVKGYLNDCFSYLEQKEEVATKAMKIETAYQEGLRKLDYVSNPKYRKSFVPARK